MTRDETYADVRLDTQPFGTVRANAGIFIRMWIQNPVLAKQGGIKVQNLLTPLANANAAISHTTGITVDIERVGK